MKKKLFLLVAFSFSIVLFANKQSDPKSFDDKTKVQSITFTENKGQISDQYYKPRPDVLFNGEANGIIFHLRKNGISYQLSKIDSWKDNDIDRLKKNKIVERRSIYRIDINWLGINNNFRTVTDRVAEGYTNYYLPTCLNGALNVKSYTGITFKNIYNSIDLHYYQKNGSLKYDYIVAPNADYKQIKLEINGAQNIELQKDGSVILKTPFGDIREDAPLVFQKNVKLKSNWVVKGNVVSFNIENYNPSLSITIDPAVRLWGTFYGGSGN